MASPKVNNIPYDFANLQLSYSDDADGEPFGIEEAFSEIAYSDSVERERMLGAARYSLAETDGMYEPEGSVTWHRSAYDRLSDWAKSKGKGVYDLVLTIAVVYGYKDEPARTDTLTRVRIASRDASHSQGPDALTVATDLFIGDRIYWDSLGPFGETL